MTFRPPATPDPTAPRFMEIATLMRAPLAESLTDIDIGLFGVPYDGALTNPVPAHGTARARSETSRRWCAASTMPPASRPSILQGCATWATCSSPRSSISSAPMMRLPAFSAALVAAGIMPMAFGGDHSVSLPLLRAVAKDGPVALVHVDAHTDTWDSFQGSKFNHGAPFRRAVEENLIDPARTIQIGIRGTQNSAEGWEYSAQSGMRVVFCEELHDTGPARIAEEACALVKDMPVYLSFDIDSLDPVYAPGTGTPEIGGMTTHQALTLLRGLRGLRYVGADLVEVSPPFDTGGLTSMAGAMLGHEILCLLAETHANRSAKG